MISESAPVVGLRPTPNPLLVNWTTGKVRPKKKTYGAPTNMERVDNQASIVTGPPRRPLLDEATLRTVEFSDKYGPVPGKFIVPATGEAGNFPTRRALLYPALSKPRFEKILKE